MAFKRIENKHNEVATKNDNIKTPDKDNAMFAAGLNISMRDDDPDFAAIMLGNFVLGGGALSNRLGNRIRQKEGISYGVGSWFQADPLDKSGGFGAYAIYAPENAARLEAAFKEEVNKVVTEGITKEELETAKKAMIQSRMVNRTNDKMLVGKLNQYQYLNRTMASWDAKYEDSIKNLTLEQVNGALKKYIDPSKISIVKEGDFDKVVKKP